MTATAATETKARVINLVPHDRYPRTECSVRPYHLWDAVEKKTLRWRYYADPKRAHLGALIEARWAAVGQTIEVYNANTGKLLGQYTRRVNGIAFVGGDHYGSR